MACHSYLQTTVNAEHHRLHLLLKPLEAVHRVFLQVVVGVYCLPRRIILCSACGAAATDLPFQTFCYCLAELN